MANGRCRVHGGKSTGPGDPTRLSGNQSALAHGIYASRLKPEEVDGLADIQALRGSVGSETDVARILLLRVLDFLKKIDEGENNAGLDLSEVRQETDKKSQSVTLVRKRPDLWWLADRFLARIGKLEETEMVLLKGVGGGRTVLDLAREIRQLQREMEEATCGDPDAAVDPS